MALPGICRRPQQQVQAPGLATRGVTLPVLRIGAYPEDLQVTSRATTHTGLSSTEQSEYQKYGLAEMKEPVVVFPHSL